MWLHGLSGPSLEIARKVGLMINFQRKKLSIMAFVSDLIILCLMATSPVQAAEQQVTLTCQENDNLGWTQHHPSAIDPAVALRSARQKGSRIIYISSAHGNDESGEFYFWDGSRLIDSQGKSHDAKGIEYGLNPASPSPAVRPFKHWAAVAPRTDQGDLLSKNPIFGTTPVTRAGYPDWWLFARNETFDLAADFRAVVPTSAANPNFVASLATSGGRSATEPQVITAYGSLCLPRPRFINPVLDFVTRFESIYTPVFRNVIYSSLHFDGHGITEGNSALRLLGQSAEAKALLFEDIWFDAANINIGTKNNAEITIRRSLLTDAHSITGKIRTQGIYYEGGPKGVLRIEESILMRNGFRGDPKRFDWPPKADQVWNIYNRNIYMSGQTESMRSGFFDSVSMMGTSGDQFRPGMRIERNFFYQGYLMIGGSGGRPDSDGPSGTVLDNVLQRFEGTGTNDNRGQPGWGIELSWGANQVQVTRNIVTGAQHPAKSPAIKFSPYDLCPYLKPTRNNRVFGNILDSGSAPAAISSVDGISYAQVCAQPWTFPGISNNSVYDNVLINSANRPHVYLPRQVAVGTQSNTLVRSNTMLIDRNQGLSLEHWKDPNRTLRTYLQSKGVKVSSEDGFPEYFDIASKMQRGRWDANWTARSLVNYIRSGFDMPALP
jgi:hypothetical protein